MGLSAYFPNLPLAIDCYCAGYGYFWLYGFSSHGRRCGVINPPRLPSFNLPDVTASDMQSLIPVAITVALMGYVGTMSICKSLESPTDKIYAHPNKELIAVGAANLVGSLCRAFPVSASFSRSAAFREAGAQTQVSAVFSSLFIAIVVLVVAPLFAFYPLPKALLSAIIIISVVGLFKYQQMHQLYLHNKREFYVLMITFGITLILGVQEGLIAGVTLSILMMIYNTTSPHMTELGAIKNGKLYRNINRFKRRVMFAMMCLFFVLMHRFILPIKIILYQCCMAGYKNAT